MSSETRKAFALTILAIAAVLGAGSFMAFLFYLYSGSMNWVHLGMKEKERLVFNTIISSAFFFQHSVMIRRAFRLRLTVLIPSHYQGAVYTIVSSLVLLAFVTFWQGSDITLLELQGLPAIVTRVFYFLSILGLCWGILALRSSDIFGLDQILKHLQAEPSRSIPFTIRGPYRWVRHPLYLFMIVLFWSYPSLTADRLLFNILWTIWVLVGTILEERDLVNDFGTAYCDYQAKVPMLLTHGILPAYTACESNDKVD